MKRFAFFTLYEAFAYGGEGLKIRTAFAALLNAAKKVPTIKNGVSPRQFFNLDVLSKFMLRLLLYIIRRKREEKA